MGCERMTRIRQTHVRQIMQKPLFFSALVLMLVSVSLLAGCSAQQAQVSDVVGPTINIGVAFDQPGMSFSRRGVDATRSGGHSVSGFHADIARELALDLGYSERQINWVDVTDQNQNLLFSTGKVDMVVGVSQYSQTSAGEGKHAVEFSGPYLTAPLGIMVSPASEDLATLESLRSKRVCTVRGEYPDAATATSVQELSHQTAQNFEQDIYSQCMAALGTGTVDAVVGSEIVLEQFAHSIQGQSFRLHEVENATLSYGVSVPQGDVRLWAKIQNKLRDLVSKGQWTRFFSELQKDTSSPTIRQMKAPQISEPPREKYD
ncbi:hypothetical protein B9G54_01380 [Alloscardovia macacae]|uniref:Solute-binding protein family 3/N-terminal domain-containing protein n=2 Tax=Alloscardovia macacae TaxID=1160091 RepID=A0A1Y2SYZ7_9BIFI|nr:hypothetical protein B9G54_01380 [Alloscardovia macacae]OTA28465.1 hypothetical protein B9T39_06695 [Alloscardovia macacae]